MKTSHKWSIAGISSVGALVLLGFQVYEKTDEYVVFEKDLTAFQQQQVDPWAEQTQANTLDRLLRRFEYLEKKKCHGGGLTPEEEFEFSNILKQLGFEWRGCS